MEHPLGRGGHRNDAWNDFAVVRDKTTLLPDAGWLEVREVLEAEHVGLVPGREPAEVVEAVVLSRIRRGENERVLDANPGLHGETDAVVDMTLVQESVGFAIVRAERHACGSVANNGRDQGCQVARRGSFAHEDPHSLPPLLLGFFEFGAFMIRLDPGREVRVELAPHNAWGVAVDAPSAGRGDLRQHLWVARDHAREVHDLGDSDHAGIVEEFGEVGVIEFCTWALERRGGNTTRGADTEGEREAFSRTRASASTPGRPKTFAISWGSAATVGRAVGEDGAHELVDPQLRRLEVHVRIDESRSQRGARNFDNLDRLVSPPADDDPVRDREIGLDPLTRAWDKDLAARDEQISRLVSTSDSEHPSGSSPRAVMAEC